MASKYPIDETTEADTEAGGLIPPTIPPSLREIWQPGQAVAPTAPGQWSAQQVSKSEGAAFPRGVNLKTVTHATEIQFYKKSGGSCPHKAAVPKVAVATREYTFTYLPRPVPQQLPQLARSARVRQITGDTSREPGYDGLKTVQHVAQLPVVQEALASASNVYTKMKKWNCVTRLYFSTAERTLNKLMITPPVSSCLRTPVRIADNIFLKSLLYVEEKFPIITLPPKQILQKTKNSVNEKLEPCITAVKNYGAKKIRNGIEAALNSLPESLVPENVHCTKPAIIEDVDDAVVPQSRRSSQEISENIEIESLPAEDARQPNGDTSVVKREENSDQKSTGAINKSSSVKAESSEICDQPQDTELKDLQNTESTRKGDLERSDCQADEIAKMVSQETKIPKAAEKSNLKAPSEITSDTVKPTSVKPLTKTIEELLGFERAHDVAGTSDFQKPPMA